MDELYREHERLFLILRLQHPWLKWCLLLCTNCQSHWVLCCLMWEGSYWLVTYEVGPVPCHLSPGNLPQPTAPQTAAHTPLGKHVLFLVFSSSLEWLLCCHIWQIALTSVKCFWIRGWVPWAAPRQAFWIWLQGCHLSKQYWGSLGSFWLTFDSRFQGNKAMPAACLSPNMFPSNRHP